MCRCVALRCGESSGRRLGNERVEYRQTGWRRLCRSSTASRRTVSSFPLFFKAYPFRLFYCSFRKLNAEQGESESIRRDGDEAAHRFIIPSLFMQARRATRGRGRTVPQRTPRTEPRNRTQPLARPSLCRTLVQSASSPLLVGRPRTYRCVQRQMRRTDPGDHAPFFLSH